jgi:hypothetical protein
MELVTVLWNVNPFSLVGRCHRFRDSRFFFPESLLIMHRAVQKTVAKYPVDLAQHSDVKYNERARECTYGVIVLCLDTASRFLVRECRRLIRSYEYIRNSVVRGERERGCIKLPKDLDDAGHDD